MKSAIEKTAIAEIENSIRKYLVDNFLHFSERQIIPNDESFLENSIIDSTGLLELIGFIEEKFSFTVEDDELIPENLDSLNKISEYIWKKRTNVG